MLFKGFRTGESLRKEGCGKVRLEKDSLDLGIKSSQMISERTVSPENHYIYNNDKNYINMHILMCASLYT